MNNSSMNRTLFGRYWVAESVIHHLDPRTKILGAFAFMITVFCASDYLGLAIIAIATMVFFLMARIPLGQALKSIGPLLFIVIITGALNIFFVQGGEVYVDAGPFTISHDGVHAAIFLSIRLTLLLLGGSLLTLTTAPLDITDGTEKLLMPLRRIGVPAHEFAMIMGITLRFLPEFVQEFDTIRAAQQSRGASFTTSPVRGGIAGLTSLLVPLFASAFRHADTLSYAMDARCYHGGDGRSRLKPLTFSKRDVIAGCVLAALLVCIILV